MHLAPVKARHAPQKVNVRIRPTVPQWRFLNSSEPNPAFVAGFGAGKTEALISRSLLHKFMWPDNDRGFYAPTYDLIRLIAWPRFEQVLSSLHIPYRLTKHPQNKIEIHGYGTIYFRSMELPARIIGYEHGDADIDELDTLPAEKAREVYERVISRNRQFKDPATLRPVPRLFASQENTIATATTPEGFRFTYEAYEADPLPGYVIYRAPTSSNPHLPAGYIDKMKALYPGPKIEAYLNGEFVNLQSGQIYIAFDRRENNSTEEIQDGEALAIGMDFNVGNMSAVVHVSRGEEIHAVDEITKGLDTPDMIEQIRMRYGYRRKIVIFPDASGRSRKSNDASRTDISQLEEEFDVISPPKNPRVRDRINAMNYNFKSRRYRVNVARCPVYARCLEQQIYNKQGEPDKTQGLDHLPDAGGYYIHSEFPIEAPVLDTGIRMIY